METQNFKIIDSHCHFWDLSLGYNEWISDKESDLLGSLKPLNQNYLPENYLKDTVQFNVEKVVCIEASTTAFATQEVDWLTKLARQYPMIGAIVGGGDLLDESISKLLACYGENRLVKGVRQILNWHKNPKYTMTDRDDDLTNPIWQKHFALLKHYDLSFDMQICPAQMQAAYELAKQFPDVIIIIDHAGFPIQEEIKNWQSGIKKLAQCPNVFMKLSGFGMLDHHWTAQSVKPCIHFLIEHFGVERCMVASNFPVDRLYSDFNTLIQRYDEAIEGASIDEKEKLFYGNAKHVYRLD